MDFHCGVTDDHDFGGYDPEVLAQTSKHSISSEDACTRIYFETEYDIFEDRGSITSVESYVAGIFNHVATLYQNENVEIGLSEIFIWTAPDPYTEVDLEDLLIQFESHRTSFNGDLAQLLTFRGIGSLPSGIAAGTEGLCNTDVSERLSVSMFNNHITYAQVPTFSWPVFIVAHELGHLFGSRHTHACAWNGNNTAIDGCGDCQEHPTPGQPGCAHCPRPSAPVGGGTIMSYCAMPEQPGVNFNLGFGEQPGNVIRNSVENADCLCSCFSGSISGGDLLCSSSVYDLSSSVPTGATVTWSATPSGAVNITGSGNSRTVTPSGGFKGFVTLRVTVTTSCGDTQAIKRVYVGTPDDALIVTASHWGPPIVREIDPSTTTFAEARYNTANPGQTHYIQEYEWEIWNHSNWSIIPQHGGGPPDNADVEIDYWHSPLPEQQVIYVRVRNPCGWSLWQETHWNVIGGCSFCAFTVYPNPAAEEIRIRLENEEGKVAGENTLTNTPPYTVRIYRDDGGLVWEKETTEREETIPTASWKEGIYHVRIHHPEGEFSQKVIIRH